MSISIAASGIAYIATVLCSLLVAQRSSNGRLRLLAFTVGLLPLCQLVVLLGKHQIWLVQSVAEAAESLELLVSALCLTTVHLLSRENADRKCTDLRLRLAEVESPRALAPQPTSQQQHASIRKAAGP
jgi:hypothetical protein